MRGLDDRCGSGQRQARGSNKTALSWDVDFNDMNRQGIHRMVPEMRREVFRAELREKTLNKQKVL